MPCPYRVPILLVAAASMFPLAAGAQTTFVDSTKLHLPSGIPENGMDVEAVDIDKDGDLDIILANEFQPNSLLLNDGKGHFTNASPGRIPQVIRDSEDIAVADFNGDGHLDIIFVSEDDSTHEYYLNDGTTRFSDVSGRLPRSKANAVYAADLTGDGAVDVVIGNDGQDLFLVNDGTGGFRDETATRLPQSNDTTQDVEMADIDVDGDLDMVLGNETGNKIYINTGNGFFVDQTKERADFVSMETRKVTFADVDGDEDVDFYVSNVDFLKRNHPQDRLYLNDGGGNFLDFTLSCLPTDNEFTLDSKFIDVDLDGDIDLVMANFASRAVKVLLNDGLGVFTEAPAGSIVPDISGNVIGLEIADLDGDGRQDIYVVNRGQKDVLLLRRADNSTSTGVKEDEHSSIELRRAEPNPFVGETTIRYTLASQAPVRIAIYDCTGTLVETIDRGLQAPGEHAMRWEAPGSGSGAFFCRIDVGGRSHGLTMHSLGRSDD